VPEGGGEVGKGGGGRDELVHVGDYRGLNGVNRWHGNRQAIILTIRLPIISPTEGAMYIFSPIK